ncbi:MAG: hypothetical protein OEY07_18790 [Gammaproteobacteria bacterium]|nr:hypothetical protein [Gammaproteobacteria bacterium]
MHKMQNLFIALLVSFSGVVPLHAAGSFDVYLGASRDGPGGVQMYGYFKNGVWHDYKPKPGHTVASVNDFRIHEGKIYALVAIWDKAQNYQYGYWEDQVWHVLPAPPGHKITRIHKINFNGSDLYVTGRVNKNNQEITGYWKNGSWNVVPAPYPNTSFDDIFFDQADVILTAVHYDEKTGMLVPHYRKNGKWQDVQIPPNKRLSIKQSHWFRGDIYQAGEIRSPHDLNDRKAAYWKNGVLQWQGTQYTEVTSFVVDDGGIYIGGWDSNYHPGYWKDGQWVALPILGHNGVSSANSMYKIGGTLFVGGFNAGRDSTTTYPGYWTNKKWTLLKHPKNNDNMRVLFVGAVKRP